MNCKILSLLIVAAFSTSLATARTAPDTTVKAPVLKKFYVGTGMDAGIFSIASIKHVNYTSTGVPYTEKSTGTVRFSYVINLGFSFNYNVNSNFGVFSGIDIKNVGYIEKISGVTYKARTYNVGIPLGIKFGNMLPRRTYGFAGCGIDFPINFKEKTFTSRSHKTKTSEWFSDRTPAVMPYVFAGAGLRHGLTLKLQYYPNNFVNPDFSKALVKPYAGTEVHLILLSLGYAIPLADRHDMIKRHVDDLKVTN